jgi:hypothetical protein
MRGRRIGYLICPLAAAFAIAPLHAQSPAPNASATAPTIKVETRVVLLDVVVTNRKGEAIPDLHQGDFSIEEDGKPQTLSAFDEHSRHNAPPVNLPALPPNVYSNAQAVPVSDSVNVLLIDLLNTQPWSQKDVCNQAVKYLKTIPRPPPRHLHAQHPAAPPSARLHDGFLWPFRFLGRQNRRRPRILMA